MSQHHKVLELLKTREAVEQLEQMVRDKPAITVDEVHTHLLAEGYVIGRTAVGNWKKSFDRAEKFSAAADAAREVLSSAAADPVAIPSAIMKISQQAVFEGFLAIQNSGQATPKDLKDIAMAARTVVAIQSNVMDLQAKISFALAEAEKDAKAGASGETVISKVRALLQIKATQKGVMA
jgi:hypothetical protein